MVTGGRHRGVVQTDATRHMWLRLCAFAPLRLCAFAPLRLCAFAPLRRCGIRRLDCCILPEPTDSHRKAITLSGEQDGGQPTWARGRANTVGVSSTRICQDCALMKSKLRRRLPASAATIRHSRESGNPVSSKQRHWVPASTATIRHSRESGNPVLRKQRRWVPASTATIRHSRESGNPVSCKQRRWVPASAGTTLSYSSPS
jgi:hypothetical protein